MISEGKINGRIFADGKEYKIEASSGMTALEALRHSGISVYSPCGGNGTCGKCRAKITGAVSMMTEKEASFLSEAEIEEGVRLACMCLLLGDFLIDVQNGNLKIQTEAKTVSYTRSAMLTAEKENGETVFYRDGKVFSRERADAKNLGLAVDIGTTTVAVYLCDMDECNVLQTRAFRNPQSSYGADVISRIDKIMKNKAALAAQQTLISEAVKGAASDMCEALGFSDMDIRAAVVCGNTVMQHIAAGIDPSSIANAPFIAPTLFGEEYNAHTLGFLKNPDAILYFAPCFASYVGGDIACGMIAAGLDDCKRRVLFIDVGTNGEIGLATEKGLYFCSAAAGPAFEGAHIACGMPGISGAVSEISVYGDKIVYKTIDDQKPLGICGSGIMDAVAVMLETGLLDETGCIADADDTDPPFSAYLAEDEDGNSIFMMDKAHDIYLNGRDIREVQLAKAAICAGVDTLLTEAGISMDDLDEVMIAGGFGSHLRAKSLCRIGLVPPVDENKITFIGNAAGAGAVMLLLGREPRESAKTICAKSTYTELSKNAYFMEKYIEEMMFSE